MGAAVLQHCCSGRELNIRAKGKENLWGSAASISLCTCCALTLLGMGSHLLAGANQVGRWLDSASGMNVRSVKRHTSCSTSCLCREVVFCICSHLLPTQHFFCEVLPNHYFLCTINVFGLNCFIFVSLKTLFWGSERPSPRCFLCLVSCSALQCCMPYTLFSSSSRCSEPP